MVMMFFSLILLNGCGKNKEVVKETELTVQVATAQNQYIARSSRYSGKTRGINESSVTTKIAGRVTQILVKPGDTVAQGQSLIILDSTGLQTALKQAEAAVASTRAQEASNKLQHENARLNYERTLSLHQAGAVSDTALEAARLQYESLHSGAVEASVAAAEAARLSLQEQVDNCNLTAPISGVVGSISVSLGDTASPQTPVAVISDTTALQVEVLVSETDVNFIQAGSQVDVAVSALGNQTAAGTISSVAPVADTQKRSFAVQIKLANPDGSIKSGMFAEVTIATANAENALCVPIEAVIARGDHSIVYTVDQESRARPLQVEPGISNGRLIQITQGLDPGTNVITKGNTLVNDGTLVRVVGGDK